jgi:hypothetical protein
MINGNNVFLTHLGFLIAISIKERGGAYRREADWLGIGAPLSGFFFFCVGACIFLEIFGKGNYLVSYGG